MSSLSAITVGNFDGVHLGHVELVRAARQAVGAEGTVRVLTFDPHPMTILRPQAASFRLSLFSQRRAWLQELGADEVISLQPSPELLGRSPEKFIRWLVEKYRPTIIVEGPDFRFGQARAGSVETLREHEAEFGYETVVIDPVEECLTDTTLVQVSSSIIRWLLAQGRVRDARKLLGRPYEVSSEVVVGDRRGRTIGVPTANLKAGEMMLPGIGIYAGEGIMPDGAVYPAAICVGTKPTFGHSDRLCEAHLIGYEGPVDDYGWNLRIQFHDWMRDQIAFPDTQALVDQLRRDISSAKTLSMAGS